MDSKHRNRATLTGMMAVLLWSSIVGLIRGVSEHFGATGGAALMYTVASVFLLISVGFPRLGTFPKRYLYVGSVLFVLYELCLSLSIGYSNNAQQAIEVGMVNYLWPTFTLIFAILFNRQRANLWVVPGFLLSMLGICWVLGGKHGIDIAEMAANVLDNPLSYGLAFAGAVIWAAYCSITRRYAEGKNGVTFFFMLVSIVLWIKYLLSGSGAMHFGTPGIVFLLLAACAMGFGYAAWNIGILGGNATLLAGASYFIPVFSAALSAVVLHAPLSHNFWLGAAMVCGGSILCWLATRANGVPMRSAKTANLPV